MPHPHAHLQRCALIVQEEGQHQTWQDQEMVPEGVLVPVIRDLDHLVVAHKVDDGERRGQEHDLHDRIVPVREVACCVSCPE